MRCGPEKDHVNLQTPSFSLEQSQTRSPGTSESTLTPLVLMQLVTHPSPRLTTDPEGLYAAGEIDCSSIHGEKLWANNLLKLVSFWTCLLRNFCWRSTDRRCCWTALSPARRSICCYFDKMRWRHQHFCRLKMKKTVQTHTAVFHTDDAMRKVNNQLIIYVVISSQTSV